MIKFSRAQRRFDYARLKAKRSTYWGYGLNGWRAGYQEHGFGIMSDRQAGMVTNTPTPCACWVCQNPRQTFSWGSPLTMQEQKAFDNYKDQYDESTLRLLW